MSSVYRVGVIVGSLRKDSFNRQLARAVQKLAPPELSFHDIRIDDLPLYNQDDDNNPHANVKRLKSEIVASQALLFATPEYNRSIPGVLKNAIDHAARPWGHSVWGPRPAGVIGISVGAPGTSMAQQHLRNVLACLDVPVMGLPEVFLQMSEGMFDSGGSFAKPELKAFMQGWMDRYVAWVRKLAVAK
jgi:chromate reductase